ncbi:abortive infection family protein [Pengzhenrongella sicca]|uniref:Abortive infection family protein n=1 Tax=Pengzhenrongella sicca TaxID=2819238 RepID=A0A8A4ZAV8_9MICO|nr:abortive infection family protein [Pengzhenrongella sicca]QTE28555.1 abortive infection family protein [Pengzhenrongella sicca]
MFLDETAAGQWVSSAELFRADLAEQLRTGSVQELDDLEVGVALTELLQSEFLLYGTSGGERLADQQARLAVRGLRATLARLGLSINLPWTDFTSFRSYWLAHGGHGSWAARREMVGEVFDPILARLYARQDDPRTGHIATPALSALPDPAAIHDHLRRLTTSVDTDPRLAVSVAKDLVESTSKLVLRERGVAYSNSDQMPQLVARAQESLGLQAGGVSGDSDEARALKTLLGSLARLMLGLAELRNQIGVGHGRESVPTWVRPRHGRLAAGAATTWCNVMLETLGDPDAPWRSPRSGA